MYIFEDLGIPLTHQKIVPGNTATGLTSSVIFYEEKDIAFTGGGTHVLAAGEWITGATSAAVAEVVSVTVSSGTFGGGDAAGTIRVKNIRGTFAAENIKVGGGTDDATITAPKPVPVEYNNKGLQAKAALVVVLTNTTLVGFDGGIPDQTALIGQPMVANSSIILRNIQQIINFKCIDRVASSASEVQVTLFF